jgi:hypothetical protein
VCICAAGAAGRSSSEGVGCLFLAHKGAGAYVAPLSSQAPAGAKLSSSSSGLQRIHVQDAADMQQARFMESFESRHSDHSFTAAVVRSSARGGGGGCWGGGAGGAFAMTKTSFACICMPCKLSAAATSCLTCALCRAGLDCGTAAAHVFGNVSVFWLQALGLWPMCVRCVCCRPSKLV